MAKCLSTDFVSHWNLNMWSNFEMLLIWSLIKTSGDIDKVVRQHIVTNAMGQQPMGSLFTADTQSSIPKIVKTPFISINLKLINGNLTSIRRPQEWE